jgi:hypothetical protein
MAYLNTPKNLLSLSSTIVWQKPKRSWIFIIPKANDGKVACWMGSMTENPDMPHASDQIHLTAFKSRVLLSGVTVDEEDSKRSVDGKMIH